MRRLATILSTATVAVCAVAAVLAPAGGAAAGAPATGVARVQVVGAGAIDWRRVAVRSRPSMSARVLLTLTEFRDDYRPRVLLAIDEIRHRVTGRPTWYRVTVPGRPNGRTGWVPAASVQLRPVDRWLVVYRGSRKFELYVRGRLARTGPVAIGAPGMETPLGLFFVQAKFVPTWPVLGAYAFETSGYSKLSDWPGGGVVGVHGTNTPGLIGSAVSHGCVRLHNRDILALRAAMPVGTPIKIVAS